MACSKPSSATSTGSSSNTTFGPFWERFILAYIPGRSRTAQRHLIKLKVDRKGRFILHFQDIDKISLVYCDSKEEDGKPLSRELKKRRDNFLAITKQQEKRGLLKNVGHGTEDNKEYHKFEVLNTALWQSLESKFSVQKHSQWTYRSVATFGGGTSSDTGLGNTQSNEQQSNEAPIASSSGENFGVIPSDTQPDEDTNTMINEIISGDLASLDVTNLDRRLHPKDTITLANNPLGLTIRPDFCHREGGCAFIIMANENLESGIYSVFFGNYGTCKASRNDVKYLIGMETIPEATRSGTHFVTVTVVNQRSDAIGRFLFEYRDTNANFFIKELTANDPKSSGRSDPPSKQQPTKKSSDESADDAVPCKKSCRIDMPMLMYLCDEMAKRGDQDFFRALIKLGILADVLANRSEYFSSCAVTAQKHGHSELAELIVISLRELSSDCLMGKLTLEKLVDAVQRERSLANSIYSSDDNSNSSLSGYCGDYDSEDDKLSSNADSDDNDSLSGITLQEMEIAFEKVELDSLELAENCEILQVETGAKYELLELETKAREKDVTERVPIEKNVPMICAQVESSDVETSSSINFIRRLDDMDTQAVKTPVVETTSVPTSTEHSTNLNIGRVCDLPGTGTPKSANIQTLFKTDDVGNDDDELHNRTIAQGSFRSLHLVLSNLLCALSILLLAITIVSGAITIVFLVCFQILTIADEGKQVQGFYNPLKIVFDFLRAMSIVSVVSFPISMVADKGKQVLVFSTCLIALLVILGGYIPMLTIADEGKQVQALSISLYVSFNLLLVLFNLLRAITIVFLVSFPISMVADKGKQVQVFSTYLFVVSILLRAMSIVSVVWFPISTVAEEGKQVQVFSISLYAITLVFVVWFPILTIADEGKQVQGFSIRLKILSIILGAITIVFVVWFPISTVAEEGNQVQVFSISLNAIFWVNLVWFCVMCLARLGDFNEEKRSANDCIIKQGKQGEGEETKFGDQRPRKHLRYLDLKIKKPSANDDIIKL